MGESFWTMHHYCWSLIRNRRAMMPGVSAMYREGMLRHSISDYEFVINNAAPNFVLLPEIFLGLGDNYALLGDVGGAFDAYGRARAIKPDYWPAYQRWAELLVKANQRAEAKKVVAEGLRQAPGAQPLIDLYRTLGGDPSEIRAAERAPAQAPRASGPDASTSMN
jgi:tetratricopeptide (TPR) repeat protein